MSIETHSDYITGSYTTDVQYVLEVAENNALREDPTLANLGPKLDSVGSVFIGYGYDLLQNAAGDHGDQVVAALQNAGATITNPAALATLLNNHSTDVSLIGSYISVPNTPTAISSFATTLLNNTISTVETNLTDFLTGTLHIADIQRSNERVALMDMYYQAPGGSGKNGYFEYANGNLTNLSQSLITGNRAEAWFEIRYRSADNGYQGSGIVARRYVDAQLFGLYTNPTSPSETDALQAYQMLNANRSAIMSYELQFGSDPYGSDPYGQGAVNPNNEIEEANVNYQLSGTANQVQTLDQVFYPAAQEEMQYLDGLYSSVLPHIEVNDFGTGAASDFNIRSVDIYAASATDQYVDAMASFALPSEADAKDSADHVLLGSETGDTLNAGLGSDILVAQAGNELLEAGFGSDTLIASNGDDTIRNALQSSAASDVMDFVFPASSGYKETVEMNGGSGDGAIDVNGSSIGGNLSYLGNDTWIGNGNTYTYVQNPSNLPSGYSPGAGAPAVGELQILVGGQGGNEIDIWGFSLTAAEYSAGGYLSIKLPPSIFLTSGATTGVDPATPDFTAGSTQSYTVSVGAPSTSAQTVTVTLSGADPSDFEAQVGSTVAPLNSNGTFTFTLAAGQTNAAFSLVNTADVGQSENLQLVASVTNPSDPTGAAITSTALTQNFVETSPDPFTNNGGSSVTGTPETSGTLKYTQYIEGSNTGQSEQIVLAGGNNYVIGGSENELITETTPSSNVIYASTSDASDQILLNGATTLAQAIGLAGSNPAASNQIGDAVATGAGNTTIVGGNGDSYYWLGSGNSVVYTGPGDDIVSGGDNVSIGIESAADQFDWSMSVNEVEQAFTYGSTTLELTLY